MRIATEDRVVEKGGSGRESAFKVKGTAKAFKILSSGLYRDKILAIVREYSCNAYDAHVAAGKADVPFKVHLPNALEPFFSIRDEGVGLSDEDVFTLCTTYFDSTKTDSNDFIGALGLGSKSGFSYVDSFTLISRFNGEKRTYVMFIGDDGCPMVKQMGDTEATDEGNGVEVSIPVHRHDHTEFAKRAKQVYEFFDPKPIVTGVHNFEANAPETLFAGKGWKIKKIVGYSYEAHEKARAIMGKVAYPVVTDSLGLDYSAPARKLWGLPIDVEFPIGDLDMTAGREELSYDKKVTIPALIKRADEIIDEIAAEIQKKVDACETELEARLFYKGLRSVYGCDDVFAKTLTWRGKVVDSSAFTLMGEDLIGLNIRTFTNSYRGVRRNNEYIATGKHKFSVVASEKQQFFVDDLPRGGVARVRHHVAETMPGGGHEPVIMLSGVETAVEAAKAALDGVTFRLTSELEKPPVTRSKASVKTFTQSCTTGDIGRNTMTSVDVDVEDGGLYVLMRNHEVDGFANKDEFKSMWQSVIKNKLFDQTTETIHFVPSSVSKDIVASEDWTLWKDAMYERAKTKVLAELNPDNYAKATAAREFADAYGQSRVYDFLKSISKHIPATHSLRVVMAKFHEYAAMRQTVSDLETLAHTFKIEVPAATGQVESLVGTFKTLLKRYPMLKVIENRWPDDGHGKIVADYIRTMDELHLEKTREAA